MSNTMSIMDLEIRLAKLGTGPYTPVRIAYKDADGIEQVSDVIDVVIKREAAGNAAVMLRMEDL